MKEFPVTVRKWSAWAPGIDSSEAFQAWAQGSLEIQNDSSTPALKHLSPIFRRRLSQLSKMVLEIGHHLVSESHQIPCVFSSRYGEIGKQYKISRDLIDAGEVSPSAFSLSVFNAPVFLLSIAGKNRDIGSALYSGEYGLVSAFIEMLGIINEGVSDECLVIFADECIPDEYQSLFEELPKPYAFGIVFSAADLQDLPKIIIECANNRNNPDPVHPLELLRWLLNGMKTPFSFHAPGVDFTLRKKAS